MKALDKRIKKEIIKKTVYTNIEVNRMKKILVKNQVEGGQVAFDLLKESLVVGAQTLGLATGSSPIALYQEMVEATWIFRNFTASIWMNTSD